MMKRLLILTCGIILAFSACKTKSAKENTADDYLKIGKEITSATFLDLSTQLMDAVVKDGVTGALKYCNVSAVPITANLSNKYGVEIKRVSHKPRNPDNNPTARENDIISSYLADMKVGNELKPVVKEYEGKHFYYAPIITMEACLQCHGQVGSNILVQNYETIQELYPNDKAIDFKSGELRGIWSLEFKNH
jgi:hypothetical protein